MANSSHVLQLIEKAYQVKADFLDLGNCGLTDIPAELEKLAPFLITLNLGAFYQNSEGIFNDSSNKVTQNILTKGQWSRLESLKKLRSLFVTRANLTASDAQSLAKLGSLTNLYLGSNNINDDGAKALVQLTDLITLDVGSNKIGLEGVRMLTQLPKMTSLYISWNGIGDEGAELLTQATGLINLDVGNNGLGAAGARALSKLRLLKNLNAYRNKIGTEGVLSLAQLEGLTNLNVSGNQIGSEGAKFLVKLHNLKSLDVDNNEIGDTGAKAIGQLTNLNSLNINRNKIRTEGARAVAQLKNLISLNAEDNELGDEGAQALAQLGDLTNLNVGDNKISDLGAQALSQIKSLTNLNIHKNIVGIKGMMALTQLKVLTSLNISANKLGNEGTVILAQLKSLTSLDIASNEIGIEGALALSKLSALKSLNIGDNQLGYEGASKLIKLRGLTILNISENALGDKGARVISDLSSLKRLDLRKNEIKDFPIEPYRNLLLHSLQELLLTDNPIQNLSLNDLNDIQALKGLAESLRVKEEVESSRHLKINLLGDGLAGKTSFADFLIKGSYILNVKERTHGILQYKWEFANEFEAQIWDFGGQDYYHGTHHLFLREENIFLLFWHPNENLEEVRNRYCYWLGNTRYFTRESTIFLIQTKGDFHPKIQVIPEDLINYGVRPENVFCISVQDASKKIHPGKRNWDYFINVLEESARQLAEKRQINRRWVAIRELLQADVNRPFYLDEEQFYGKYFLHGDHNELAGLLSYLEFSGAILRFQQIELLQKRLYLDPKGLTDSIYRVFDQNVMKAGGHFDYIHLKEKVGDEADAYLELMFAYDLIFSSPNRHLSYVVPQYLPDFSSPYGLLALEQVIQLSFALYYPDYLHQGMIFAFIAQYGQQAIGSEYWRYGLLFEDTETRTKCLVRCDLLARRIYVHLHDNSDKLKLAARIFDYFSGIGENSSYQKARNSTVQNSHPEPDERRIEWSRMPPRLSISMDGKQFMDVRNVRDNLKNSIFWGSTINEQKRLPLNATLHFLLNDDFISIAPKKVFFSYSHKDEIYKQELDAHLSALKRSGKIETWHDRKILPGEAWDESIMEQLKSADILLLLLSADFMNSDYIWKKEIRTAQEQSSKTVNIVPIFLRPCDFDLPELYTKQGIPRDTRWIVSNERINRDEGYLQVVKELKLLL